MRKSIKLARKQKKPTLTGVTWGGLDDPATLAQLDELGDLRHAFMATAKKDVTQKMKGAPDLPSIRNAITKPELMDINDGDIGQSLSLLEGGLVKNAPDGHSTYNTSMYGGHFGELTEPSTVEKMFPSFQEHRRLVDGDPTKDHRSRDLKMPWQLFDRETIAGMKGSPLLDIEGSSTGERIPFGGGGYLQDMHKQPYDIKQKYDDDLGDFNPYEAAGFDVDNTHKAVGAWSEGGDTQYNPVRVEKPIFEGGLLDNMDSANAVEHYKGLVNVQAGSPFNTQTRAPVDEANALRLNFRAEPSMKEVEKMSLLAADNDMFLSPSGFGKYSLLNGNPADMLGDNAGRIAKEIDDGMFPGSQSAIIEPVKSSGDYIDLEGALATRGQGKATQAAMDSWDKVMPMMEKMLGDPSQKAYITNKIAVDAKAARDIGDITREDYNNLYSILSNPDLSGKDIIKKLKEGIKNGGLPAAGFMTFEEDER
jgi:hypothetical protein